MPDSVLQFKEIKKEEDITNIANFDIQAFADSQDFRWSVDNIKNELKVGWKLYSVQYGPETVAAMFIKNDKETLFTKNTPIKMAFQGNGFSHQIKDFYELEAARLKLSKVVNYCPDDNFRMIALNESHGYKRAPETLKGAKGMIVWEKNIK